MIWRGSYLYILHELAQTFSGVDPERFMKERRSDHDISLRAFKENAYGFIPSSIVPLLQKWAKKFT